MPNLNSLIPQDTSQLRAAMGLHIVYFSLAMVGVLGAMAVIALIFNPDAAASIKDMLSTLLPVLGTWVGSVLAFYFTKENYNEAARQTVDLVRQLTPEQKLEQTLAGDVMIAMDDSGTSKLVLDRQLASIPLVEILQICNQTGRNRLPLLDGKGTLKFLIHRSLIDKFITEQLLAGNGATAQQLSLHELLSNPEYLKMARAFETISRDDNLTTAKHKIDSIPECSDVFVTEDGTRNSRATGWITNVIIAERATI